MNTDIQIDKRGWEKVTFGEVAFEPKESFKNPKEAGIEHVVGLEHIDSADIHLRKSNTIEESTTFTKAFQKGDILFGRRRAYLKKAAIAEFSGICSGDITVFRAKENILPELLPFVVHNEKFFDYAVKHSAGGLSPRVKFKDLANYEFLLPPKDQQTKLAELLWAMDDVIERENEVLSKNELLEKSMRYSEINNLKSNEEKLDKLILPMSKIKVGKIEKTDYQSSGLFPIVDQSMEFIIGYTDDESLVYKDELPVIVFGDHTTILKFINFPFVMGADGTKVIKPNFELDVFYLHQALKELNIKPQGYRRHFSILKNKSIKIPKNRDWVIQFRNKMAGIIDAKKVIESKISSSKGLQKSLINQVF